MIFTTGKIILRFELQGKINVCYNNEVDQESFFAMDGVKGSWKKDS